MYVWFPLTVGALGSLHCFGMCGPLVLAYSLRLKSLAGSPRTTGPTLWSRDILHHVGFHVGRLLTYGLMGALAGGLFQAAELIALISRFRNLLSLGGGLLLLLLGLALLKILPFPAFSPPVLGDSSSVLRRWIPVLYRSNLPGSKILLGMATGLLPCCLSWAMVVTAATTGSTSQGFRTMVLFGLGTVPILFATGISASWISRRVRFVGERLAACSVLAAGVVLILKGARIIA